MCRLWQNVSNRFWCFHLQFMWETFYCMLKSFLFPPHFRMKNRSSLSMHTKIHSNDRQYGCMVCDQKFVQKINLINHLKVHNTTKTHSCTECGKRFVFVLKENLLFIRLFQYLCIRCCVFFLCFQLCWSITIAAPLYSAH